MSECRLRELARDGARAHHEMYWALRPVPAPTTGEDMRLGHVLPFAQCPHPDCVLVREPVDPPPQGAEKRYGYYPHMCRDGHEAIGWRGDGELCPVCMAAGARETRTEPWQPIETAPKNRDVFFWCVPKVVGDEGVYAASDGTPIVGNFPGYRHTGKWGTWSSLAKPTCWMEQPAPPRADVLRATAPPAECSCRSIRGDGKCGGYRGGVERDEKCPVHGGNVLRATAPQEPPK